MTDQPTPETLPARLDLRDRIAEALLDQLSRTADIRPGRDGALAFMPEITDDERLRIADAILAVRDREMEQLRADLDRVQERACSTAEALRLNSQRLEQVLADRENERAARAAEEKRARAAEAVVERVRAELDRIAALDTVTRDDGRADRFSTGARWTLRMIRENALDQPQQPGCEHCGASVSHLPSKYMKGGTVGYCRGELTTEQQPTT